MKFILPFLGKTKESYLDQGIRDRAFICWCLHFDPFCDKIIQKNCIHAALSMMPITRNALCHILLLLFMNTVCCVRWSR